MTTQKWNLVPVDCWRELEPYLGKDVPNREVVLLSDVKGALAAPQPTRLSDDRILSIGKRFLDRGYYPFEGLQPWVYSFARAIEREIFGGGND